ncbi:MAG: ribonuclease P protein component 4 [Candidatus Helarchaeales archaeon]
MVRNKFKRRKTIIKEIGEKRIKYLYELADRTIGTNLALAQDYARLARRIALRLDLKIPKIYSMRTCNHCKSFLKPGINCRVRTRSKPYPHLTVFCYHCRRFMRKPLKKVNDEKHVEKKVPPSH